MIKCTTEIQNKISEVEKDIALGSDFLDHLRSLFLFVSKEFLGERDYYSTKSSDTFELVKRAYKALGKEDNFWYSFALFNQYRIGTHYRGDFDDWDHYAKARECVGYYNQFVEWIGLEYPGQIIGDLSINEGVFASILSFGGYLQVKDILAYSKSTERKMKDKELDRQIAEKTAIIEAKTKILDAAMQRLDSLEGELVKTEEAVDERRRIKSEVESLSQELKTLQTDRVRLLSGKNQDFKAKWKNTAASLSNHCYSPCGATPQDRGFLIQSLHDGGAVCNHPFNAEYAVVFSYLQRNCIARKSSFLMNLELEIHQELNYYNIFRIEILVLLLIRNGLVTGNCLNLESRTCGRVEIEAAVLEINDLAEKICGLEQRPYIPLRLTVDAEPMRFEIDPVEGFQGFSIISSDVRYTTEQRMSWQAPNPVYNVDENNKALLEEFARELFPASNRRFTFRPGQFDALVHLLNSREPAICLMPTGSGKSLLFYIVALLKSKPTVIVAPTDVLIQNQIQHLRDKHCIDDIDVLVKHTHYRGYMATSKFIFATPEVFQNYSLVFRIIELDHQRRISNLILDEVHCVSHWGHDFRPDYMILSNYFREFAFNTTITGFTGTADYTVLTDIMHQLGINKNNVISPVAFSKDNIDIRVVEAKTKEDVIKQSITLGETLAAQADRSIFFTCAPKVSELCRDGLKQRSVHSAVVFDPDEPATYESFAAGAKNVMISHGDMGIGVDLDKVTHVAHIGFPASKPSYVQEIGRAGRMGEPCAATIICRNTEFMDDQERALLNNNLSTDQLVNMLGTTPDLWDLSALSKLCAFDIPKHTLLSKIIQISKQLEGGDKLHTFLTITDPDIEEQLINYQRYLYILFRVGLVGCWFMKYIDVSQGHVEFYVERDYEKPMPEYRRFLQEYISNMGNFPETVDSILMAKDINELIYVYIEWYFDHFVYHHRRQFLDLVYFFEQSKNLDGREILDSLGEYFSTNILFIEDQGELIRNSSIKELFLLVEEPAAMNTRNALEQSLARAYVAKWDMFVLVYDLLKTQTLPSAETRLAALDAALNTKDRMELREELCKAYFKCSEYNRYEILYYLVDAFGSEQALEYLYHYNPHDELYYSVIFHELIQIVKE